MRVVMTSKKGFKIGLLISFVLLMVILLGFLIAGFRSYDGVCISVEPPEHPCTFIEYIIPYLMMRLFFPIIIWPIGSYLVAGLLLLLPFLGYLIGERNQKPALVE
jgi:hypothetical protein